MNHCHSPITAGELTQFTTSTCDRFLCLCTNNKLSFALDSRENFLSLSHFTCLWILLNLLYGRQFGDDGELREMVQRPLHFTKDIEGYFSTHKHTPSPNVPSPLVVVVLRKKQLKDAINPGPGCSLPRYIGSIVPLAFVDALKSHLKGLSGQKDLRVNFWTLDIRRRGVHLNTHSSTH